MPRSKTPHQTRVEDFMLKAEQEVPNTPTMPDAEIRVLRAKLILEEALETITRGLGIEVRIHHKDDDGVLRSFPITEANIKTQPDEEDEWEEHDVQLSAALAPDMEELADGCIDLSVVTMGTLSACGIADASLLAEVDAANLRKFAPGGYKSDGTDKNPVGKWIKPKGWTAPDINGVLARQAVAAQQADASDA